MRCRTLVCCLHVPSADLRGSDSVATALAALLRFLHRTVYEAAIIKVSDSQPTRSTAAATTPPTSL